MSTDYILETQDLTREFKGFIAVDKVNLQVKLGSIHALIGPNGAGKTTMFNLLTKFLPVTSGKIIYKGEDITKRKAAEVARTGMVRSFQISAVFPHLTVLENLTLSPMWVGKIPKKEAEEKAMQQLERVKIAEQALKYPLQLSGGQQQRVAIARALCLKPKIMLFDEPTSALDPEMIKEVLDVMVEMADAGITMICVTHEMGFAKDVADRVIFMDQGQIVEQNKPDEFFKNPQTDRAQDFLSKILGH
jgi:general L-amino acid transport system ATP-binding protein